MVDISNINTIAVIGAGTMGHEIAQVSLMAGFEKVVLNDITAEIIDNAVNKIESNLKKLETKGLLHQGSATTDLMKNLHTELNLKKAVSKADFIIEAIPEKMELKQELFRQLGQYSPKHAILATNTSTMSITKIASKSGRPDKVVGMHFFTPIVVLRLIEMIKGEKTSEETMNIAIAVGKRLPALKGKKYIARIEKESPGFIVNRLIISGGMYFNWLLDYATEKGVPIENIDADLGSLQDLGPFAKWDYLGLDIVYNVLKYFEEVLSSDFKPGKVLTNLFNKGDLGRKTGKGIFEWTEDGQLKTTAKEKANLLNMDLYFALQLNEGCKLLEEGIVSGYKVIDDTMFAGMDMPGPFGPGKRNYVNWCKLLEDFVEKTGKQYFIPCELMKSGGFLKMRK
jgi:enoyl-CoA hydratase/3-hydroxyacyl-CoA dehydrogenase